MTDSCTSHDSSWNSHTTGSHLTTIWPIQYMDMACACAYYTSATSHSAQRIDASQHDHRSRPMTPRSPRLLRVSLPPAHTHDTRPKCKEPRARYYARELHRERAAYSLRRRELRPSRGEQRIPRSAHRVRSFTRGQWHTSLPLAWRVEYIAWYSIPKTAHRARDLHASQMPPATTSDRSCASSAPAPASLVPCVSRSSQLQRRAPGHP